MFDLMSAYSISIHALREEGDCCFPQARSIPRYFYPRPPRGGRRWTLPRAGRIWKISIHALREEGDQQCARVVQICRISIHALREEGDWGEPVGGRDFNDFYPRPPRGGRHFFHGGRQLLDAISIHALREEGDSGALDFLLDRRISIHALREEGDALPPISAPLHHQFLSTPSARRATLTTGHAKAKRHKFLSTPSARRATRQAPKQGERISDFYPRPPRGGRPW